MEYKPGWDCHGLPIELKALQSIASSDEVTDPVRIRQLSRKFASDAIKQQKKSIRQWESCVTYPTPFLFGIFHTHLDDKDKTGCYYTFTKDYEISELRLSVVVL